MNDKFDSFSGLLRGALGDLSLHTVRPGRRASPENHSDESGF